MSGATSLKAQQRSLRSSCTIDRDLITTWIFTRFGKSVRRAVWEGLWHCLERRISGLVIVESIRVLGPSFYSKRRQVLFKIARFHIGYNLFAPYLLFYCTNFSHILYPQKRRIQCCM